MSRLDIALIQAPLVWEDAPQNLAHFDDLLQQLGDPVDLVVLPEMFNTGFSMEPASIAESMDGPGMQWLAATARRMQCVVAASLIIAEAGKFYNRLIWMQPNGQYQAYDKRHLFRLGGEHLKFTGGDQRLIVELKGWKICPLICYDLRFPVWSKNAYQADEYAYDLLLYLANWPARRAFAWEQLLPARAIENQCYVAGINRIGIDGKGIPHKGGSQLIDFKGKLLWKAPEDEEVVAICHLDKRPLQAFRKQFTVGLDWDQFSFNQ